MSLFFQNYYKSLDLSNLLHRSALAHWCTQFHSILFPRIEIRVTIWAEPMALFTIQIIGEVEYKSKCVASISFCSNGLKPVDQVSKIQVRAVSSRHI